ncbi:MAG: 3-hydroxybutyrate oligomer hydrolase family protein [Pseudolabrys sp.]
MASATTDALTLPLRFRSQRAAFNAATPNRFAFKHAHSHANPENDRGRNVLRPAQRNLPSTVMSRCRGKNHSSENGHGVVA